MGFRIEKTQNNLNRNVFLLHPGEVITGKNKRKPLLSGDFTAVLAYAHRDSRGGPRRSMLIFLHVIFLIWTTVNLVVCSVGNG